MTELMRPPHRKAKSRAMALWRDRIETVEIEPPTGVDAAVLCLTNRYQTRWTANGRRAGGQTGNVDLAGIPALSPSTSNQPARLAKPPKLRRIPVDRGRLRVVRPVAMKVLELLKRKDKNVIEPAGASA